MCCWGVLVKVLRRPVPLLVHQSQRRGQGPDLQRDMRSEHYVQVADT